MKRIGNFPFNHLLTFGFVFLLLSCQSNEKINTPSQAPSIPTYPVIEVPQRDISSKDEYPASLEGVENIEIRAKVDGYIQQIYVDEGTVVKRGQPLLKLETQTLTQNANAAESSIKVAEAQVNIAQVEVDKLKPLVDKGIISDVQLKTAEANLASAQSQLEQSKSNYKSVSENIRYTNIVSPVNGIVGALPYRKGSLVGRSEAMPLTTVSNISSVYAYFGMNEKDFLDFIESVPGDNVEEKIKSMPDINLTLANGKPYAHSGKIETVTGQIDPQTGTINFRAKFPNPENQLRTGSSGIISIPKHYTATLLVPERSTFENQGRKFVFVLGQNDSLYSTPIEYIDIVDGAVLVSQGLKKGDKILAKGVSKVRNGMVIKPEITKFEDLANTIDPIFK
ncbi:efflux RND transporter periplasmic adaptor subunit [Membranihabitans marinus]|uniref:efflux RND transporter periplasmic adaptor subunit n=1 Tax=Membranihabitans marinus TaxID=1227546 RepID=UPI001F010A36|nr:efflux RND transporter periplasmic adaptor subunit [Membranihabitans marinus]